MKRWLALLIAVAAPVLVSSPALAGIGPSLEFTFAGSGTIAQDLDSHQGTLEGSAGLFILPNIEVGARQSINYVDSQTFGTVWNGSTRGFVDWQLTLGPVAPFIGANLGGIYGDGVPETGIAGPEGGLKLYFSKDAFLFARVEYQILFDKGDPNVDVVDDGQLVYAMGIGFRF
jgi:hypothetical protein